MRQQRSTSFERPVVLSAARRRLRRPCLPQQPPVRRRAASGGVAADRTDGRGRTQRRIVLSRSPFIFNSKKLVIADNDVRMLHVPHLLLKGCAMTNSNILIEQLVDVINENGGFDMKNRSNAYRPRC